MKIVLDLKEARAAMTCCSVQVLEAERCQSYYRAAPTHHKLGGPGSVERYELE